MEEELRFRILLKGYQNLSELRELRVGGEKCLK